MPTMGKESNEDWGVYLLAIKFGYLAKVKNFAYKQG